MPRLIVTGGPLEGQQFSFASSVIVGRGVYSDVRLDDSTVSRRHAEIFRKADGIWCLRDLGSANGTLYRGAPLSSEITLEGTLELVFGEIPARLEISDALSPATVSGRAFPQLLDRLTLLASVAGLPAQRNDSPVLIGEALDLLMTGFAGCQRCSVFMMRADGATLRLHSRRDRSGAPATTLSLEIAQACLRHTEGVVGDARVLMSTDALPAPLCLFASPLLFAGETLGVLLAESTQADTWNPLDQPIAKAIGSVIAGLLDAERASRPERVVAERDLLLARRVQQHFLPQATIAPAGYTLADCYVPARAVGGDHFDFFQYSDGRFGILIADVAGKAVSGALVMARLGMAVRLLARRTTGPCELLAEVNAILHEELEAGMFVTAQALALSPATGDMEIANAGHPPPFLRDPQGAIRELVLEPGSALGIVAQATISNTSQILEPGANLLLHSDGLGDAENANGEAFGTGRALHALAEGGDAVATLATLNRALAAFVGDASAADDLTLVVLSRARAT